MPENPGTFNADILDHTSDSVAVLDQPGEETPHFSPGVPPEGHRIRVDANDLKKEKNETKEDFSQRKREYANAPDPYSPTGRKKGKIYLYDWDVKCIGKNKLQPARINGVPAAPDAIREFLILRRTRHAAGYRFRAFPVPNTKRDAGDAGYSSTHVPEAVRRRRLTPEDRAKLEE